MVVHDSERLREALVRLVKGDLRGLPMVLLADHATIREVAAAAGEPLIVTRLATVLVLRGLLDGTFSSALAQAWASFVRRGYVAGSGDGPVLPIDIEFAHADEDGISTAVSRLDEIGDVIDGQLSSAEILALLQLLGEP
ncbi:hypothetical protein KIH31_15660 [Paenarthrobacter sp. DKR-5]|uniref:hypothetical protein n=1 Tax=Paenarthrobacter sp. DKR-5 TaxID=2835535 RepID=UPI001BDD7DD8|nr:hypothetical protein [Paenarthrobacter sp. DKR-5]MBT1004023.1 hypothetical protein [Paenarthrobacter sp. DKR-5]